MNVYITFDRLVTSDCDAPGILSVIQIPFNVTISWKIFIIVRKRNVKLIIFISDHRADLFFG